MKFFLIRHIPLIIAPSGYYLIWFKYKNFNSLINRKGVILQYDNALVPAANLT